MNQNVKALLIGVIGMTFVTLFVKFMYDREYPPAYLVVEAEVIDPSAYNDYENKAAKIIKSFGGEFIVRGGKTIASAGLPPKRIAISIFPTMEKAEAFQNSEAYKEIIPVRDKASKYRAYIAGGSE